MTDTYIKECMDIIQSAIKEELELTDELIRVDDELLLVIGFGTIHISEIGEIWVSPDLEGTMIGFGNLVNIVAVAQHVSGFDEGYWYCDECDTTHFESDLEDEDKIKIMKCMKSEVIML